MMVQPAQTDTAVCVDGAASACSVASTSRISGEGVSQAAGVFVVPDAAGEQ
ncbi:hypothetical protein ACIQNI_32390 [Streptomyces sp. NPDC091266]|uniref:hypothetical protein n=1 Tax=Streptomyces sp. NPDC091266 TaxID=3365978 RepID=UPI0038216FEE